MYDYIRQNYAFQPEVGRRVMHDETRKEGVIRREDKSQGHYVQVQFDGAKYALPCHPGSLIYVEASA